TSTEHGRSDRIQFISNSDLLRHLPDIRRVTDPCDSGRSRGDNVSQGLDSFDRNAGVLRCIAVAADGIDVATENREMKYISGHQGHDEENDDGIWDQRVALVAEQTIVREIAERRRAPSD